MKFRSRHNFDLSLLFCPRGTRLVGASLQPTCISVSFETVNAGAESLHGTHCMALARNELFNDNNQCEWKTHPPTAARLSAELAKAQWSSSQPLRETIWQHCYRHGAIWPALLRHEMLHTGCKPHAAHMLPMCGANGASASRRYQVVGNK